MVTRGPKSTPYQDPRMSAGPATLVIIAEHKDPLPTTVERGLSLFTVHVRRAQPDTLDPKLNSHSKLNDITACIQAYTAGRGRGVDARPTGIRRHLQLDALLHRARGRGMDLDRHVLPRRHHPRERAAHLRASRHPVPRAQLQPDRGLQRRRGLRHRYVRRPGAGAHGGRPAHRGRPPRADGRTAAAVLPRTRPPGRRRAARAGGRATGYAWRCGRGPATSRRRSCVPGRTGRTRAWSTSRSTPTTCARQA